MPHRRLTTLVAHFLAFYLIPAGFTATAAGNKSRAAHLVPPSTVIYAEFSDPKAIFGTVLDHPLRKKIEALPAFQQFTQSANYQQMAIARDMVQNHFQMSWRELMNTTFDGGVALAIDSGTRGGALIIQTRDAKSAKTIVEKSIQLADLNKGSEIKQAEYRDVTAYRRDDIRLAVYEDRILITNNSELGKSIIDRLIDGGENNLYDNPRFQSAWASRNGNTSGWAFVDIEVIRESGVADAVYSNQINNPVGEMLVGGIQSTLGHTPYATIDLTAQSSGLDLTLSMPHQKEWIPEHRQYFFGPNGKGKAPRLPPSDQTLATISTHRDFAEMWLRAGDLFNEDINDEFAKADATLTTIFAGRDFGEDILGSIEPEVGLVVTRQDFSDRLPRPSIKIPAFALVMTMKDSETVTRDLRRTFQSMVGFFNVVGAMNGLNQLELDMEKLEGNAQLVTSQYVPETGDEEATDAKIIFNFSPTVGFSGDRFVLSSTIGLARELTLAAKPNPATIAENTSMQLISDTLKATLADNCEQLIAQNMLEDGNSREEAEAVIDMLLEAIGYFNDVSLSLKAEEDTLGINFYLGVSEIGVSEIGVSEIGVSEIGVSEK